VKTQLFTSVGNAMVWQTVQYGGEKVIFLVRLMVLARLLTPYDFGLLALALFAIDILMRLSNFGMTAALVQLEDASPEHYDCAWTMDLLRGTVIALTIFFASPFIAEYLAEPAVTNVLRALAVRPILDASASIMTARFSRNLNFRALVFLQFPKALTNTFVSIFLARTFGIWALVAGTLAGSLVFVIQSYILAPHRPRIILRMDTVKSLARFGRWVFLTSIVIIASQASLRVVISRQLGATELGLYYLAASLAFMPTDVANQIVGVVAFPFYSRLQKDFQEVTKAFRSVLIIVTVLLLPISVLMIAVAPTLVNDVFGEDWAGTVKIIRMLLVVNIFDVLGETIIPILNGTGNPNKILVMESLHSLVLILVIPSLTDAYGVVGAAMTGLPATIIAQGLGLFFLRRLLDKPFSGLSVPIMSVGLISIIGALGAIGLDLFVTGWVGFVLASIAGVLITGSLLWISERKFALGLLDGFYWAFPPLESWIRPKLRYEE
jgi:O-antigen/teichoic acid export membrane protein